MRSTRAEDINTHAVSPVSIFGAGAPGPPAVVGAAAGAWAKTEPAAHRPKTTTSRMSKNTLDTLITASPP
jgi:hypothetical protein